MKRKTALNLVNLIGGFSTFRRVNNMPIYQLKHKDEKLLYLDYINSTLNEQNGVSKLACGFFFILCLVMLIKLLIGKREISKG